MHPDLTLVRCAVTLALFVLFIALCVWAWSGRRRDEFAAAALLPFDEPGEAAAVIATRAQRRAP
jgi:cytochrome c oxidase cbb3-type subunit 4